MHRSPKLLVLPLLLAASCATPLPRGLYVSAYTPVDQNVERDRTIDGVESQNDLDDYTGVDLEVEWNGIYVGVSDRTYEDSSGGDIDSTEFAVGGRAFLDLGQASAFALRDEDVAVQAWGRTLFPYATGGLRLHDFDRARFGDESQDVGQQLSAEGGLGVAFVPQPWLRFNLEWLLMVPLDPAELGSEDQGFDLSGSYLRFGVGIGF